MKKICYLLVLLLISAPLFAFAQIGRSPRSMLLKSTSQKDLVETARNHQWSIDFTKRGNDTLHIIALRVEFVPDTSTLTTGNGEFGFKKDDRKESNFYLADTVYKYDNLRHDSIYFVHQLTALRNYYGKVSRGSLTLDFSLYPTGGGETGYKVPNQMTYYSPGWKRKHEKTDEYWERKTHGLMMFVADALIAADDSRSGNSPFRNLYRDDSGILRDAATGRKAVILILHAGASYLTDGGATGEPDSPSDMIDAFINQEQFRFYKDTLKLKNDGVSVTGYLGDTLTIDEVMMCAETSNQDGVNWGIQGVLVNQLARQLGIPDLFSTSSGISAVGAFCIMDFAGYSAGQGFIPPYPSAWVRAFMGWDKPYMVGAGGTASVKALTSVIDREDMRQDLGDDTTILLIPINSNEYYLVENRQRNLSGDKSLFNYDEGAMTLIKSYPYNVNIGANVKRASPRNESNVILEAKNNDVSLPASGVLVWHIDERVIRQRLAYNIVNADSSYRGVRLVEADGVNDLGVAFTDAFYQAAAFDFGGAEDVFPHLSIRSDKSKPGADVRGFGPYTRPSTRANDGGHTYLSIGFTASNGSKTERMLSLQGDTIVNYSDSSFIVDVRYDYLTPGWPRRAAPESFYDPLVTKMALSSSSSNKDTVLTVLSESGRLYLYSVNGGRQESYGNYTTPIRSVDYHGKPVNTSISVTYFDSIPGVFTFPTAIAEKICIPSVAATPPNQHALYVYNSIDIDDRTIIPLPAAPSSYVCGINNATSWALGLVDGRVVIGNGINPTNTIKININSNSPICAIAALKDSTGGFAVMQDDGTLSIIKQNLSDISAKAKIDRGIAPFALVTGDLDNDGKSEIIISDSKQGVWVYTKMREDDGSYLKAENAEEKLVLALGWKEDPNDWANAYYFDPQKRPFGRDNRDRYAQNASAPALADLNRDGHLDIILSGTNGIYALNRKGALLSRWPAYLDNRYWYQRGSVTTAPIAVSSGKNEPMVLFSSPTGENATFSVAKIIKADKKNGVVTFRRDDGALDSIWDLSAASIDTIITIGDSLVYPYVLPGGFVDALTSNAARPVSKIGSWAVQQSRWPLSAGSPITASPLVYRASSNVSADLFAVSSDGMVYRWGLSNDLRIDSLYWPQNGFDAARSFAYGGAVTQKDEIIKIKESIIFWNYPNPTSKDATFTTFKYQFSGQAKNVRLDIHTITGYKMDTFKNLSGNFPDWNEHTVNLEKYGPGIYRCRMEAVIDGKKRSSFWKMAVVK